MAGIGTILLDKRLEGELAQLPALLDGIEAVARGQGWDDRFRAHVLLVIEELVVNAMSYGGCAPGQGWVHVLLTAQPEGLEIRVVDNGQAFDPFAEAPLPDLDLDLDRRAVGGLGVHFVLEMTDRQAYHRTSNENHVVLMKHWSSSAHP